MDCIFCEIVARRIPANIIYQDGIVTAFHDNNPQAPVHILIIPNVHLESMNSLSDENKSVGADCLIAGGKIASELGLSAGYRFVTNVGVDGGQQVAHLHFHLLAGRKMEWPPG